MWRLRELPGALVLGGVAAAQLHADRRFLPEDFAQGFVKIFLQVVTERAQRRDVEAVDGVEQLAIGLTAREIVEHREEGGEGFASAGGRSDEHILPSANARPGVALRRSRPPVLRREPI